MVKWAIWLMSIFFLLSLAIPCWSQTTYSQGSASSDSDRLVYPRYDPFGMPLATRPNPQTFQNQSAGLPPGAPAGQGSSQPASQPVSQPATQPATNPVSH